MQVSSANDVRIYNLSSGKSLPEWLGDRQRRKLEQKNLDIRRRIQLIQGFEMPDVSHTIDVSPDGRYIFASGSYKPFVKCFDLKNLSLKFERGLDADVVKLKILSDDFSKIVLLEEDRYVEMHVAFGRFFRLRIPRPGRDMDFCKESADLYIVGSTPEIYRLNLEQGVFLEPLLADATHVNCCQFSPIHQLFVAGTSNGTVEAWDQRDRKRVGILDVLQPLGQEINYAAEVSAIQWQDALHLGVGTSSGHILTYDIRSRRPLLVKDQQNSLTIKKIDFVERENDSPIVLSMDSRVLKMWHRETGQPMCAIEPPSGLNDFIRYPASGLVLMACEAPKMLQYFIPALGTAPKWCAYLETITEELEETEQPAVYDDYKFVSGSELEGIGLSHLIGTNVLKAYMHGYFMDVRLYNKARTLTQPFAVEKYKERKIREKMELEREQKVVKKKATKEKAPKVNADLAERWSEQADALKKKSRDKKKADTASALLDDSRFKRIFENEDFTVDETSEAFMRLNPAESAKRRKGKSRRVSEEKDEEDSREIVEQVDLSDLRLNEYEEERQREYNREEGEETSEESGGSSSGTASEDDAAEDKEEKERQQLAQRRRQRKVQKEIREEEERKRRLSHKPNKFILKELLPGETATNYVQDAREPEAERNAPLAAKVDRSIVKEGREDSEVTPFGGKVMSFELKRKGKASEEKEEEGRRQQEHIMERKQERRKLGAVRKLMTSLPGNLVLDGRGRGRGGRGRARGRGRGAFM